MLYNLSTLIRNEDELSALYTFLSNSEEFTIYNMNIEGFKNAVKNDMLICCSVDTIYPSRAILFFYISSATLDSILYKNDLSSLTSLSVLYKGETISTWSYGNTSSEDYCIQTSSALPIDVEYRFSFNPPSQMITYSAFASLIKIVTWICICCMILAFALAFLTYRPIKRLTSKIVGAYDFKNHDDLQVIEQQYDKIVNEKEQLERSIIQYRSIARNHILSNLLYGVFNSEEYPAAQYGITLSEDSYYRVIILHIEESFNASYYAYVECYNTENALNYPLLQLADGDLVFIIEEDDSMDISRLSQTMSLLCTYLEQNNMEAPDILYGTQERGAVGISMSYQNARESLLSINNSDVSSAYFYPTDWEIQLINLLKLGNSESVSLILEQIQAENEKRQLRECIMIKLIKIIFETLLRVAVELDMDTAALSGQFWDNVSPLDSNAKWEYISNIAENICKKAISVSEDEAAIFSASILEYVKENSSDPLISLAKLQDIFGISQPSISRLFKKAVKINFNDYLSRLRIENAKILLDEYFIRNKESSCIAEIARKVGYDCDVTFRRVFKRYEGVTPSQYINRNRSVQAELES